MTSGTNTILPRHVICVLGNWKDFSVVESIVEAFGPGFTFDAEYSLLAPDERMVEAFRASVDNNFPTLSVVDLSAIKDHQAVAYILSPSIKKSDAESISANTLLLAAELLRNGGVAVKSESAGLAHGRARWIELAEKYKAAKDLGDEHAASATLYRTWVQRAIHDTDSSSLYSVGMHLLGHPDTEIEDSVDVASAVNWIDLMGLYLVADKPKRALLDGQGFRLNEKGPRRILHLEECLRYPEDDFFFNPVRLHQADC